MFRKRPGTELRELILSYCTVTKQKTKLKCDLYQAYRNIWFIFIDDISASDAGSHILCY